MRKTTLRRWLDVGDRDCCNCSESYDGVIHVYRDDLPDFERYCCEFREREFDLRVNYQDGAELPRSLIEEIVNFVYRFRTSKLGGRLLIHCAAGCCRSPTIALLVLSAVEKIHPLSLLSFLYTRIYTDYNEVANIVHKPLHDIVDFFEEVIQGGSE